MVILSFDGLLSKEREREREREKYACIWLLIARLQFLFE